MDSNHDAPRRLENSGRKRRAPSLFGRAQWLSCIAVLLATSKQEPTIPPILFDPDGTPYGFYAPKQVFGVESAHPLAQALNNGLRKTIKEILTSMELQPWRSFDFLQLRYKDTALKNPVVILLMVEKGIVDKHQAQSAVDAIKIACNK